MKMNNFRGDLTDISAKKEALQLAIAFDLAFSPARSCAKRCWRVILECRVTYVHSE